MPVKSHRDRAVFLWVRSLPSITPPSRSRCPPLIFFFFFCCYGGLGGSNLVVFVLCGGGFCMDSGGFSVGAGESSMGVDALVVVDFVI